jgi:hypothetical protein
LPILFRLYQNKKTCTKLNREYRKKTELGRELVDLVVSWTAERPVELSGDSAYSCSTVIKGLPARVVAFGNMRPDAVITAWPSNDEAPQKTEKGNKGRPGPKPKRGKLLPKPEELAKQDSVPWKTCTVDLNGKKQEVTYKDFFGQWYRACGFRLLHIVVVQVHAGKVPWRVFFSTDASLSVQEVLSGYAQRWPIEVCFRELKQCLGFADSSARKKEAVLRTAPFVGLMYTVLVIWFVENRIYETSLAALPPRPWYTHKVGLSFQDVLRAARRALAPQAILDLRHVINNLGSSPEVPCSRGDDAKMVA